MYIHNPNGNTTIERRAFGDVRESSKYKVYVMPAAAHAWEQANTQYTKSQNFKWKPTQDNKGAVILDYTGNDTELNIPEQIWGFPVVELAKVASGRLTSGGGGENTPALLTSVTIPDSVQIIGERALQCGSLTSGTFGKTVKSIGKHAFFTNKITSITLPDSLTFIGYQAFSKNELTNVTIPSGVTAVSGFGYNKLKSVTLHDRVTSIEEDAFRNNKITSAIIPNSVTKIDQDAFINNNLKSIVIPDSVTELGEGAFGWNKLTSVTIGKGITEIKKHTFEENALTEVTIPDNIKSISNAAFIGEGKSNNIAKVIIPNHTEIGRSPFNWQTEIYRQNGKKEVRK
jgi:hypothetical protein